MKVTPAKRQKGQYYTEGNPFVLKPFLDWVKENDLGDARVLEPFAGANNIIRALQHTGFANSFASYDIEPNDPKVSLRDTLVDFPRGFNLCVTNPPWLAKNSAKRRGLSFPATQHDDLYKYALEKCLAYCGHVAAIIPATFLQSGIFHDRLESVIMLHDQRMFLDTDNPVCLALFSPQSSGIQVFHDSNYIGNLEQMRGLLPKPSRRLDITFNHPEGELGFIAFDNTKGPTIRFVMGSDIANYPVGSTSRMITRIKASELSVKGRLIDNLNSRIDDFRSQSSDVFLTPFKGLRKDGMYRRRMDYRLARDFIEAYA